MTTKPLPSRLPKYRHYKPRNLAVVRIDGHDHYLGAYDSPASREKYRRLIGQWLAAGQVESRQEAAVVAAATTGPTVKEVIAAYWRHCETYYRNPAGSAWQELDNVRVALRPLKRMYGDTLAERFDTLALQAIRAEMIRAGLCRTTINARVTKIRRAFKWAGSVKLIPGSVFADLTTIDGLQPHRSDAPEPKGVEAVAVEIVEATLPHMPRPVAAMVRLQLLTGCRVGEVVRMRGCDLTTGEPVWEYRPAWHKNSWRGKARIVVLGPRAQAVVGEFLQADPSAPLFSPRSTVAERCAERSRSRASRPTPSEKAKRAKRPGAAHADRYSPRAYHLAIVRACARAFPCPALAGIKPKDLTAAQRRELADWNRARVWSPLQLRHTSATILRARFGIESTAVVLGHADAGTTLLYTADDLVKARAVMAEVG